MVCTSKRVKGMSQGKRPTPLSADLKWRHGDWEHHSRDFAEGLEQALDALVGFHRKGPYQPLLVSALHLKRWAETTGSRAEQSRLIRHLAHESGATITAISMPTGESINLPDWDDMILCSEGSAWVPTGRSLWNFPTRLSLAERPTGTGSSPIPCLSTAAAPPPQR